MPLADATAARLRAAGLPVREDVPLADRVWWRVGGPADGLVEVDSVGALCQVQATAWATGCPVFVLGNGSNLLVADRGVRGLVVVLTGALADARPIGGDPLEIEVGGGFALQRLVSRALRNGWTGLEAFAGIPGTMGGAVRMNAGAQLGETADSLVSVEVVLPSGEVRTLSKQALRMSYRTTHLPEGAIVASARLRTTPGDVAAMRERVRTFLDRRKATQPLELPNCGSTFRNPPGDFAGRLIEAAGLKGHTIGGAQVSEKHANFIVNLGTASAADVRAVIEHVQRTVEQRFGVALEREVQLVGDWGDEAR